MKKFQFRLETLLKVKQQKEDSALRLLGLAQQKLKFENEKKSLILNELSGSLKRREDLGNVSTTKVSFQVENDFIVGTKQRILQQDHRILVAKKNVEKAMRGYLLALKHKRIIEKLREKALAEYKVALSKKEQKDIDDLVTMRARLRTGEAA